MFGLCCFGSRTSIVTRREPLKSCLRVCLVVEHWKMTISGTANKQLFSGPSTDHHSGAGQLVIV